jgi:hypothetical protein
MRTAPGQYDARIVAAGATDCSLPIAPDATNLPPLVARRSTTLALVGSASLELLAFSDDRAFPGAPFAAPVALRFIHAAPALPAVDVGIGDIGDFQQLFLSVPFGTAGNFREAIANEKGDAGDAGSSWPPVIPPIPFVDDNGYQLLDLPLASAVLSAHVPHSWKDIALATDVSVGDGTVLTVVLTSPEATDAAAGPSAALDGLLVECIDSMADAGTIPPCVVISRDAGAPSPDAGAPDAGASDASALDAGASDAGASDASAVVTFSEVYTTILKPTCSKCHGGLSPFANLDMSTQAGAYSNLVGVKAAGSACGGSGEVRVVAGSSATSLMYHKVAGTQDCGVRMPYGGPYLDQAHIDLIKTWIDEGAPNN